ncbi:MAG: ABC transporter permease [Magnetospirillum sp.]
MAHSNIFHLGVKELRSLWRDPVMVVLIVYAFSFAVYAATTAMPDSLQNAPLSVVDEDRSPLSRRMIDAFYPPRFLTPKLISAAEMDARMDAGQDTFALDIPPGFERDLLAGRNPVVQLNIDATRMSQAFSGAAYVQTMVGDEVRNYVRRHVAVASEPVALSLRVRFNPQLDKTWFGAIMEVINNVTMLSIVLTGAALIREREHGTIEHLLVMPVTPFEIMAAKVWSMGLVVLVACTLSLLIMVRGLLGVPVAGSIPLFLLGAAFHLFATTSMGIFLGTLARSMPQFGLLLMLVLLPLQMLSGGITPRESMPEAVQMVMMAAPTTHFIMLAQAILYRGAGLAVVWPQILALAVIGGSLFGFSLARFRKTIGAMG